jgi:hypothetical protein
MECGAKIDADQDGFCKQHAPVRNNPRIIEKKCQKPYFEAVRNGSKPFEIRLDDGKNEYRIGRTMRLNETDPETELYTGQWIDRVVTHVVKIDDLPFWNDIPAKERKYVVIGFGNTEAETADLKARLRCRTIQGRGVEGGREGAGTGQRIKNREKRTPSDDRLSLRFHEIQGRIRGGRKGLRIKRIRRTYRSLFRSSGPRSAHS